MTAPTYNIFVVGLDDVHLAQLKALPDAENYRFHALYTHAELKQQDHFPVAMLLDEGIDRLKACPEQIDAVVGYWDFPVSTLLPLLREAIGLPTTSLESVLKCEHKYWSRVLQREVIPEYIPPFAAVDPFAEDVLVRPPLPFPFWLKPVKSLLSHLGFRVEDHDALRRAIREVRAGISRYAVPFNRILQYAKLPPEIMKVDGHYCIAEAIISEGRQCTLEGYVWRGDVVVYGVVDSLRDGPAGSSFSRYQYPSTLPVTVIDRMRDICRRFMRHIGYRDAPFNIEFYWDERNDRIWLLEINTRISKSHAPLFYMVDGCYHHKIMLDLALQRAPELPHRQGAFACAAKFMLRRFEDAFVTRVPSAEEIRRLEGDHPGVTIQIEVEEGMRLSSLRDQDSYSYEVAVIFVGAHSEAELEAIYGRVVERLPLEFSSPRS
ncbi:MAG: D-alanine--D-alanine ligase [Candidatus Thiodiazotropha sp.]